MSSIVSLKPPFSVFAFQVNEQFLLSLRFGTARTLSRRANERRVRGASMEAKTATPLGLAASEGNGGRHFGRSSAGNGGAQARPAKIAQGQAYPCEGRSALTDPALDRCPYVAGWPSVGRLRLSAECWDCSGGVNQRSAGSLTQVSPADSGFAWVSPRQ